MPCENIKVSFKPANFFERNPAIDVPPSTQEFNKSVLLNNSRGAGEVMRTHHQNGVQKVVLKNGVVKNSPIYEGCGNCGN